jgi:cold shock CspA family protein
VNEITGTIGWWDAARGYGLAIGKDGEAFVHATELPPFGADPLKRGDKVRYVPQREATTGRTRATNITVILEVW